MNDFQKTKEELISEINLLKQKIADLENAAEDNLLLQQEILRRKDAEKQSQESEVRYRSLIEAAPVSILAVQDGRYVFANSAATS